VVTATARRRTLHREAAAVHPPAVEVREVAVAGHPAEAHVHAADNFNRF
jgi:hypothetical protein